APAGPVARLQAARRDAAAGDGAGRLPVRGRDERLRRHAAAGLPGAGEGPLGDHRLRAGAAVRPPAGAAREGGREVTAADTTADRPELARWQRGALLVGAAGAALAVLAMAVPATRVSMFRGWLVAFNACLGVALGSLVILMLQWVVGGGWGFALRRPLEA